MEERYQEALRAAKDLCEANDSRLLYLTVFGAELYGTATGSSDLDARGVFLPSLRSIVLGQDKRSLRYSTGQAAARNTARDMDIDLWSLSYWTLTLLPGGDTGALDLLFSPSNEKLVLLRSPLLDPVFANPLKFLDLANNRAFARYSLSQAKKYGVKGSRLGTIKAVWKWLEETKTNGKLGPYIDDIVKAADNPRYCFAKDGDSGQDLVLCGKIHVAGVKMDEFRERVRRDMDRYGSRAKAAEENQGVDYKALSHALRALDQMDELLLTGRIKFPLATRERLIQVKKGAIPWIELEPIILAKLAETDRLYDRLASRYTFDAAFAQNFLLGCYGLAREPDKNERVAAIRDKLAEIAKEENVEILYAVEAGSRAWGFPSIDSDYDVRFIYARKPISYLTATPERE
nr:nucleotidyltransferase domain-containing protein [Desulfovibrio sp.]